MRFAHASAILLVSLLPASLPAQGRRQVQVPSLPRELDLAPSCYLGDRLLVKFSEELRVRLPRDGKRGLVGDLGCAPAGDTVDAASLQSFARLRHELGDHAIEAVFSRPVAELDDERVRIGKGLAPGIDPPADLANWYRFATGSRARSRALLARLLHEACVETAEPEFRPEALHPALPQDHVQGGLNGSVTPLPGNPPPALDRTPQYEGLQFHMYQAPLGLGFVETLGLFGAQGHLGQTVVQVEAAWNLAHEDLPGLRKAAVLGKTDFGSYAIPTWIEHGTACVGILNAARDGKGVRGYVPLSTLRVSSAINGYAEMISLASRVVSKGDVVSSSLVFAIDYQSNGYHAPLDWPQVTYDALRSIVLAGIPVTCAAGNTGTDLAVEAIYGKRYAKSSARSGVFLCGATIGPESKRVQWSNFGEVVEVNAWGFGVTTTGYGQLQSDARGLRTYTNVFGGTSAASPQVAGVLAALQSMAVLQKSRPFRVDELRAAIAKTGVPIGGGIGMRPLLPSLARELGLWRGLRVLGDTAPGEQLQIEVELAPGTPYMLFLGATPTGLDQGLAFRNQVVGGLPLLTGVTAVSGVDLHRIHVPAEAAYAGLHAVLQALYLDKSWRVELSNAAELWLR